MSISSPSKPVIPDAPITTKQQSSGRVAFTTVDQQYYLMVWNDPSDSYLKLGTGSLGTYATTVKSTSANAFKGSGPAIALFPAQRSGVVAWVNAKQYLTVSILTAEKGTPVTWKLTDSVSIPGTKVVGSPTATATVQNGRPVVTVIWQDANAKSMVYAQIDPGNVDGSLGYAPLGASCTGSPCLLKQRGTSMLAYMNADQQFTLAGDPLGGVGFDFDHAYVEPGITSATGPGFVPVNNAQAFVLWATGGALRYQQLGKDTQGTWQMNSDPACSGTIAIAAAAAPDVRPVSVTVNGTTTHQMLLAVPGAKNAIQLAGFTPDFSPIPIVQA